MSSNNYFNPKIIYPENERIGQHRAHFTDVLSVLLLYRKARPFQLVESKIIVLSKRRPEPFDFFPFRWRVAADSSNYAAAQAVMLVSSQDDTIE